MIDWDQPIAEVIADLETRDTVNFIITADHMDKHTMFCRECGKVLGDVFTTNIDNLDFECTEC